MKTINLIGKTALVTGGAGQLGRTICRELARCGANIAVHYFNSADAANALAAELAESFDVKTCAVHADVCDFASVEKMRDEVFAALGFVDIIVNNSVVQYKWTTVIEQDLADYESQFRSCVMQGVHMTKAFVPAMKDKKEGRVIAINTECAMQNFVCQSAYVAGKRGMDGLYKVLARELGEFNITVNQVAPGWTISDSCRETDGTERNIRQDWDYNTRVPLGRRGTDLDIANAVCFIASDLAGFITGVYLPVTGGNVMPCI